jgi:AraC-like DNA-binding protein
VPASTALQNRYDRIDHAAGVLGWVYEYRNTTPIAKRNAMATGLELGVQLRGEWFHHGARTGARMFGPDSVHVISPGERYELSCSASRHETGLQVGFIVYPDEIEGFAPDDRTVSFRKDAALDERFGELCRAYADAVDRGAPLGDHETRAEVLRWVRANVRLTDIDPLSSAKRFIERTFASPLYLEHIAEVAGMSSVVFSRRFARRFGPTPIAYRIRLRINEAARLTWARPDLTVAEIGALVGFDDERYFHRAFVAAHGMTPALYGRRSQSA